jgi:hypothetical protein
VRLWRKKKTTNMTIPYGLIYWLILIFGAVYGLFLSPAPRPYWSVPLFVLLVILGLKVFGLHFS